MMDVELLNPRGEGLAVLALQACAIRDLHDRGGAVAALFILVVRAILRDALLMPRLVQPLKLPRRAEQLPILLV